MNRTTRVFGMLFSFGILGIGCTGESGDAKDASAVIADTGAKASPDLKASPDTMVQDSSNNPVPDSNTGTSKDTGTNPDTGTGSGTDTGKNPDTSADTSTAGTSTDTRIYTYSISCSSSTVVYAEGGTCTADQACASGCGPDGKGMGKAGGKGWACTDGKFVRLPCTFKADDDYACYKLPSLPPACPAGATASGLCSATECTPCGSATGDAFLKADGISKAKGFCVCHGEKWTCGSLDEYPCYSKLGAPLPASCL